MATQTQTQTQTKYTNDQIRGAILRAADRIEREPGCYDFFEDVIPECGTRGCMYGWIGVELGVYGKGDADMAHLLGLPNKRALYNVGHQSPKVHSFSDPTDAVVCMRIFADKYFPASSAPALDSAYLAFRAAFTGAMEAA